MLLYDEIADLKRKLKVLQEEVEVKRSNEEILNDEVSYYKYAKDLMDGVLENCEEEIGLLKEKIGTLEQALKGKTKQLLNFINRDRGKEWQGWYVLRELNNIICIEIIVLIYDNISQLYAQRYENQSICNAENTKCLLISIKIVANFYFK